MKFFTQHWFLALLGAVLVAGSAHSQVPGLPVMPAAPATSAAEKPDETKARLLQWQKESKESLARLEDPAAATTLPEGITGVDLEVRRRDTEQTFLTIGRYIKTFDLVAAAAKATEAARARNADWVGFKEKPPYSVLMLDELLNEQDVLKVKLSSHESSLLVFERTVAAAMDEMKAAAAAASQLEVAINKGEAIGEAAKWQLEALRSKSRYLAARSGLIYTNCEIIRHQIDEVKADLALVARKVKFAKTDTRFSDEDLKKIQSLTADRRLSIKKELEALLKRQKAATLALKQAQSAADSLVPASPDAPASVAADLAKLRLETAEDRVETLDSIKEALDALFQLEDFTVNAYQDRKAYLDASSASARQKALGALNGLLDRLKAWEVFGSNEAREAAADLEKLESRAAALGNDDPRLAILTEQKSTKADKRDIHQRIYQTIILQRRYLERWVDEFTPKYDNASVFEKGSIFISGRWNTLKKIWSFEVMEIKDRIEVDGEVQVRKTPVTFGELFRAVFFFVIAYWIAAKAANRIQRTIVGRGHVADAQARTLRNWAMIVVGVFLAIATLSLLKIPLTVFAFFGGALAIGLGFGSQTLIKNFISGIIVLFERKIRVGDVVDVGGLVGGITEINTRSSVLRSGDGKETLIPNSFFLENRVTNLTLSNRQVRRVLNVIVDHGCSPQQVNGVLKECVERHGLILKEPAPIITLENFTDQGLEFAMRYWTELDGKTNADVVASDLRFMIDKRFTELEIVLAGAEVAMPISITQPVQIGRVPKPEP